MRTGFALTLSIAIAASLCGCSGLKSAQKDVAELKTQANALEAQVHSAQAAAEAAKGTAQAAHESAGGAQSAAAQALSATQASKACCTAVDQQLDGAFRQALAK